MSFVTWGFLMQTWTKASVNDAVDEFLWSQWGQLGMAGVVQRTDRWAIDPEALLRFTLLFAPRDARLFDETLDWLCVNGRLVSAKRLRNLARDPRERRLMEASLAWAGSYAPRLQLWARRRSEATTTEQLADLYIQDPDPRFAAWGFVWPNTEPSGKSIRVDPSHPITLAFRLRLLIGVGARAEIIRYLLTTDGRTSSTSEIAHASGFGRRNVADALSELAEARAVEVGSKSRGQQYSLEVQRWEGLLDFGRAGVPLYVDWIRLLESVWKIVRWFDEDAALDRTEYIRASDARRLVSTIEDDLIATGVKVPPGREAHGVRYTDLFQELVSAVMKMLQASSSERESPA